MVDSRPRSLLSGYVLHRMLDRLGREGAPVDLSRRAPVFAGCSGVVYSRLHLTLEFLRLVDHERRPLPDLEALVADGDPGRRAAELARRVGEALGADAGTLEDEDAGLALVRRLLPGVDPRSARGLALSLLSPAPPVPRRPGGRRRSAVLAPPAGVPPTPPAPGGWSPEAALGALVSEVYDPDAMPAGSAAERAFLDLLGSIHRLSARSSRHA